MQTHPSDSPRSIAAGDPYVRRSANPASSLPWQVRRNRPDQTFEVVSEHATEGEAAATIGPAPTFGDWFAGIYASPENPTKYGMYVRTVRVPHGRMNPGIFYELTDGHGKFWQYPVESTVRHGAKRPTDAQVETAAFLTAILGEPAQDGVVSAKRGDQEFFLRPDGTLESGIMELNQAEVEGLPHRVGVTRRVSYGDREVGRVESMLLGNFGVSHPRVQWNSVARRVLDLAVGIVREAK